MQRHLLCTRRCCAAPLMPPALACACRQLQCLTVCYLEALTARPGWPGDPDGSDAALTFAALNFMFFTPTCADLLLANHAGPVAMLQAMEGILRSVRGGRLRAHKAALLPCWSTVRCIHRRSPAHCPFIAFPFPACGLQRPCSESQHGVVTFSWVLQLPGELPHLAPLLLRQRALMRLLCQLASKPPAEIDSSFPTSDVAPHQVRCRPSAGRACCLPGTARRADSITALLLIPALQTSQMLLHLFRRVAAYVKGSGGSGGGGTSLHPEPQQAGAEPPAVLALQQCETASLGLADLAGLLQAYVDSQPSSARLPLPAAPMTPEVAVQRARALALRSCANPRCTDLSGPSEAALRGRRCGGCGVVRYCSEACSHTDWRAHKAACRLLKRQRQQQREGGGEAAV